MKTLIILVFTVVRLVIGEHSIYMDDSNTDYGICISESQITWDTVLESGFFDVDTVIRFSYGNYYLSEKQWAFVSKEKIHIYINDSTYLELITNEKPKKSMD